MVDGRVGWNGLEVWRAVYIAIDMKRLPIPDHFFAFKHRKLLLFPSYPNFALELDLAQPSQLGNELYLTRTTDHDETIATPFTGTVPDPHCITHHVTTRPITPVRPLRSIAGDASNRCVHTVF